MREKMKVVILNTAERRGGAAVAAERLCISLNRQSGVEAKMIVRDAAEVDSHALVVGSSWIGRKINFLRFVWERAVIFLFNGFNRKEVFKVSIANTGTDLSKHPAVRDADIIHLHWINQGFLSLSDIRALIASGKHVVWTLHDMWAAIGYYHHYPYAEKGNMENEKNGISSMSLYGWNHKRMRSLDYSKITFVGCSRWIAQEARGCYLTKDSRIYSVPNPINTEVYKPLDENVKKLLGFDGCKPLVLFAAANVADKRKGIDYFVESCRLCSVDFEIIVMGGGASELAALVPQKVHSMGYVSEVKKLVEVYNCADVFVIPSLEDNLPNTIMESLSCGVPCVGFAVGGIPEMIDHKRTGYVSEYKNSADLARGLEWVLSQDGERMRAACIEKVKSCYAEDVVAKEYLRVYRGEGGLLID